jgi:hypothetical protein
MFLTNIQYFQNILIPKYICQLTCRLLLQLRVSTNNYSLLQGGCWHKGAYDDKTYVVGFKR